MDFGKLFFSAYGRIGRQEFWLAWVILLGVGLFTAFIPCVNLIVWAGGLYCSVCIRAKRLHDMGRTGWWQIIPHIGRVVVLIAVIYFTIAAIIAGVTWNMLFAPVATAGIVAGVVTLVITCLAAWLVDVGFLLWIGTAETEPYDNIYGPLAERPVYPATLPATSSV